MRGRKAGRQAGREGGREGWRESLRGAMAGLPRASARPVTSKPGQTAIKKAVKKCQARCHAEVQHGPNSRHASVDGAIPLLWEGEEGEGELPSALGGGRKRTSGCSLLCPTPAPFLVSPSGSGKAPPGWAASLLRFARPYARLKHRRDHALSGLLEIDFYFELPGLELERSNGRA